MLTREPREGDRLVFLEDKGPFRKGDTVIVDKVNGSRGDGRWTLYLLVFKGDEDIPYKVKKKSVYDIYPKGWVIADRIVELDWVQDMKDNCFA